MAHRRFLIVLGVLAGAATACGDGSGARTPSKRTDAARPAPRSAEYATDDATWGRFHSKRFQLSIPLPNGRTWKIDDHTRPELVAVHAETSSRLAVVATHEQDLMNRQRCEERARALGWVPEASLATVDDDAVIGPDAYDSRVWVALQAAKPGGAVEGHVFLFGAFLRQCLLVHLSTSVPSANDEDVLSSRLAIARARIIRGIVLDPLRTTDDASVPRDKPEIRR